MHYPSNPGVDETVIVYGLKGQYIWFAAFATVAFIVFAAILGSTDIPILLVVLFLVIAATTVMGAIIRINRHYGRYGLMKMLVLKRLPSYVRHTIEVCHIVKNKSNA